MYVCICMAVTEAEVHDCIAGGASTTDAVGEGCGAGTGCGSCRQRIERLLAARRTGADSASRVAA